MVFVPVFDELHFAVDLSSRFLRSNMRRICFKFLSEVFTTELTLRYCQMEIK